jgi:hypothetical protein
VPFMLVHGAYAVYGIIESIPKMYPIYIKRYSGSIPVPIYLKSITNA